MACLFPLPPPLLSSPSCAPSFLPSFPPPPFASAEALSNKYQISKPTLCSVHPGEVLKLSCPLPEVGTITWTKDGSSLGANNRTLIEQDVLQIRDATPKDSGLYACSSVGRDTLCFIVNVTGESGEERRGERRGGEVSRGEDRRRKERTGQGGCCQVEVRTRLMF